MVTYGNLKDLKCRLNAKWCSGVTQTDVIHAYMLHHSLFNIHIEISMTYQLVLIQQETGIQRMYPMKPILPFSFLLLDRSSQILMAVDESSYEL